MLHLAQLNDNTSSCEDSCTEARNAQADKCLMHPRLIEHTPKDSQDDHADDEEYNKDDAEDDACALHLW
jgi:hypothetical protein